jgi:hypothetical protein
MGAIFNSGIINRKHKNVKNMALNRLQTHVRHGDETKRQSTTTMFHPQLGMAINVFPYSVCM